jgi:hypothetical protein
MPSTDQETVVFVVLETVAVTAVVVPNRTEVLAAITLTLIGAEFAGVPEIELVKPPHPVAKTVQNAATKRQRQGENRGRVRA